MADETFKTVLPALKAVDNGDGTFSIAISLAGGVPSLIVNSLTFDIANQDIVLSRVAANILALAAGDMLAVDEVLLDRTNRDVRLYRLAADTLGIPDEVQIAVNSANPALTVTQAGAGEAERLAAPIGSTLARFFQGATERGQLEFKDNNSIALRAIAGYVRLLDRNGNIVFQGLESEVSVQSPGAANVSLKPGGKVDAQKALYNSTANNDGDVLVGDVLAWDGGAANGEKVRLQSVSELLTIAAAATTDTVIDIPANVVVKAVTVRVTVIIPTAATFTVTGATTGTVWNTVAVPVAATTTDKGNLAAGTYNVAAQKVRITPNIQPANNTGRVRITIFYEDIIPPTS